MDGIASKQINEQQQHEQKHFLADTTRHTIQHITIKTRYISYTRLFLHMSRAMSANRLPPPKIVHTNKCVCYNNEQQYNVILMYAFYAMCAAHTTQWPYSNIEQWAMSVKMCGAVICFLFCCCCAELIWSRMDGTVYGWWTGKVVMGARCLYGWRLRGRQQINIRHTYNTVAYEIIKHRERERES